MQVLVNTENPKKSAIFSTQKKCYFDKKENDSSVPISSDFSLFPIVSSLPSSTPNTKLTKNLYFDLQNLSIFPLRTNGPIWKESPTNLYINKKNIKRKTKHALALYLSVEHEAC
jgi:hypothetical protein